MNNRAKFLFTLVSVITFAFVTFYFVKDINPNPMRHVGVAIDSLNGVKVYYNGGVYEVYGENVTYDGYFIGFKYQCVEFTNRYYLEHYHFKMKDPYGNAKEFFEKGLPDGSENAKRGLLQFTNPSNSLPKEGDLVVFDGFVLAPYGHVAIVSEVTDKYVQVIQQNAGPFGRSRLKIPLINKNHLFLEKKRRILGWLRMK